MTWLTWRQIRSQVWAAAVVLAVVAVALALTGARLSDLYTASGLGTCAADDCGRAQALFAAGVQAGDLRPFLYFAGIALMYLTPAAIGMFWGAPLIARELEAGTLRLAWTQTVTRSRWLLVRLGLPALAAVLTTALLSLAVTWWAGPLDRAGGRPGHDQGLDLPNRFAPLLFGARDAVPAGHAAFGFVLGVAVGLLMRRAVAAMAVTLAILAAVQVLVPAVVREHYREPLSTTTPLTVSGRPHLVRVDDRGMEVSMPVDLPGAWITSVRTVDSAGRPYAGPVPEACTSPAFPPAECDAAVDRLRLGQLVTYQPAGRYWTFQWVETVGYLLLALGLTMLCAARIRRLRLS
ncbi:ABC transporter permease [Dactylosporangium siamense]|uniref:Transporter n=1 Tax=Dactylosporangium siamense TaxID=685454 RepID=A0A919UFZ5_9ACTN|nr:ABC transporter permease [Dactylosporangium siamense]GIG49153.1 transporter [Dactylosporangium siamense]